MNPVVQQVLERLCYEKILVSNQVQARRRKIHFDDLLQAAQFDARIFTTIPALILYRPSAVQGLKIGLKKNPKIQNLIDKLFVEQDLNKIFFGIPLGDYKNVAVNFYEYLERKKHKRRSRVMNLRLADQDLEQLKWVSEKMNLKNLSETIRTLVAEKAKIFQSI